MKTNKAPLIISVLGLIALCLITVSPAHAYSILVYGSEGCGYTQAMRQKLNNNKYRYTYYLESTEFYCVPLSSDSCILSFEYSMAESTQRWTRILNRL
jgi:thioredoxin-related protein